MPDLKRGATTVLTAAVLLVHLADCTDGLGGFLIGPHEEMQIGEGVDQEIELQYLILDDGDPVAVFARQLVEPLAAASGSFRDPGAFGGYKVEVIFDNELVNAFAAPGGFTYITTGLILESTRCAEIGGVMGHELAHVTQRHGVKKLETHFGISQLAAFFLGESFAADAAVLVFEVLSATEFSRDDEAEADSVGMRIAFNAGYNPYGLVDFFERLAELEANQVLDLQFLSSHPASADRVRDITAEIQSRYGDEVVRDSTQSYGCVGTDQTLEAIQQRIVNEPLAVRAGTGGS